MGLALVAATAGAVEVPGTAGRVVAGGYLDGLAIIDTGGGPRQRPEALGALTLDAAFRSWLRGFLAMRGRVGGPFEGGSGVGLYNFGDTYQNYSPAVEAHEAWLEARTRRVELRAGVQTFAWGKLDGIPPTDVLNPRDFHDPLVDQVEERKIGVPAVLATVFPPDLGRIGLTGLRMQLAYVPWAVPSRLGLLEERWFPSSAAPPSRFVAPAALLQQAGVPATGPLVIPSTLETTNDRPPRTLDLGGLGLRTGGTWRDVDWDVYYYTGPATGPNVNLRPELQLVSPLPDLAVRSRTRLAQTTSTVRMVGADGAIVLGGFSVRAEVARLDDQPYLRPAGDLISPAAVQQLPIRRIVNALQRTGRAEVPLAPLSIPLDSVEWGIGADYLWNGWRPILQLNQVVITEPAPRLLISDPETRVLGVLRRQFWDDRVELELRAQWAFTFGSWWVLPLVSYRVRDDLRLRLGYLALGGPRTSLIGEFGDNDEVVLQARYTF